IDFEQHGLIAGKKSFPERGGKTGRVGALFIPMENSSVQRQTLFRSVRILTGGECVEIAE
ncbi:MAG: hypothetical protein M1428_03530, partial [Deltaproteobacteria bacterium]|nr:hypothetical protein [Deltaproteobacteria bacterium]